MYKGLWPYYILFLQSLADPRFFWKLGLGRATFFMVRVGFRACSFSPGWARATGNLHGLISGRNILNSGRIRAAFGPHSGHIWATIMYK